MRKTKLYIYWILSFILNIIIILWHQLSVNCRPDIFFDCTAWTGLNDLGIEGTYVWDDSNEPLTYSNWHYHEPSLLSKSEALTKDCIDMLRGGVWNDRPCSYLNWVICEKTFWTMSNATIVMKLKKLSQISTNFDFIKRQLYINNVCFH